MGKVKKVKKKKGKKKGAVTSAPITGDRPIKEKMTKAQLLTFLSGYVESHLDVSNVSTANVKRITRTVMEGLESAMVRSLMPRSLGQFMLPQLLKIVTKKKPAIKKGTKVRNPATGEMIKSKGRPASKRVKVSALSRLKKAATGEL